MTRPPNCHACGKWIPQGATVCPHCDTPKDELKAFFAGLFPKSQDRDEGPAPLAPLLLLGMVALFGLGVVSAVKGGSPMLSAFMNTANDITWRLGGVTRWARSDAVLDREYWRFVTANFLHFGVIHLVFNGMSLAQLIPLRQAVYGAGLTLAIFLGTGVAGMVAAYGFAPSGGLVVAGASAGLFGLGGVGLGDAWRSGDRHALRQDLLWIATNTFLGLFIPVSHTAHFGGLLAGFFFGASFPEHKVRRMAGVERVGTVLGFVSAAVILGCFALAANGFGHLAASGR